MHKSKTKTNTIERRFSIRSSLHSLSSLRPRFFIHELFSDSPIDLAEADCSFQVNLCGWSQVDGTDSDWLLTSNRTPPEGTGPWSDHTTECKTTFLRSNSSYQGNMIITSLVLPWTYNEWTFNASPP